MQRASAVPCRPQMAYLRTDPEYREPAIVAGWITRSTDVVTRQVGG